MVLKFQSYKTVEYQLAYSTLKGPVQSEKIKDKRFPTFFLLMELTRQNTVSENRISHMSTIKYSDKLKRSFIQSAANPLLFSANMTLFAESRKSKSSSHDHSLLYFHWENVNVADFTKGQGKRATILCTCSWSRPWTGGVWKQEQRQEVLHPACHRRQQQHEFAAAAVIIT